MTDDEKKAQYAEWRAQWMERAKSVSSMEDLTTFLTELIEFKHDYNTIVEAVVAGMYATLKMLDRSKAGGLSGFQASALGLKLLAEINDWRGPFRVIRYSDMLYPQYAYRFEKTIDASTWSWLREEAVKLLHAQESRDGLEPVQAHWKSILEKFEIPFGYTLAKRDS